MVGGRRGGLGIRDSRAIVEGCHSRVLGGQGTSKRDGAPRAPAPGATSPFYGRPAIAFVIATRDATVLWMMRSLKPLAPASVRARRVLEISWRELRDETCLE
jgi:hypothetical protein